MGLRLSRFCAYGITALAVALGLDMFRLGLLAQVLRLMMELHHGLGFADPECTTGYCDYSMFWLADYFVRHGNAGLLYDHARYASAAASVLPYKSGWWPFVYPPTLLPLAAAISLAPLAAGYYGFCLALTGLSVWLLRRASVPWWCIIAGLIAPATMWNLYLGQLGLLCGALLVAGLSRESGFALGLLCIKPQYALLVPVAVLAARLGRVVAAGIVTVAMVLSLSLLCGGLRVWAAYLGPGRAAMAALLNYPFGASYQKLGSSVFWMARSLDASIAQAWAAQGAVSALAAVAVWRWWREPVAEPWPRITATVFLTLLASPYGFTDDLAIYAVLLPTLARRDAPWRNAVLAWLWVAPAFVPLFVKKFGFLPTPLLVLAALGLTFQAFRSRNNPCSPNRLASAGERRQGEREPASSAASHCSTL